MEPVCRVISVETAVTSNVFGVESIRRLDEAVKKRKSLGSLCLLEWFTVNAACVVDGGRCNAYFTVNPDGSTEFQQLQPYTDWNKSNFVQVPSACAYCNNCLKPRTPKATMMRCSHCEVAQYCDKSCQTSDWSCHQRWCAACARLDKAMPMVFASKHIT
jgi:hypothetical protein